MTDRACGSGTLEGALPTSIWSIQHDGGPMRAEDHFWQLFELFWSIEHDCLTNVLDGPF